MVAADLHADNDLVRLCQDHRTQSGNRFSQCKRCAAVQDSERLARTFVHGHRCFHTVFRCVGVLDAEVAHQGMLGAHIKLVERNFRRTYFCQDCFFYGEGNAVFFVGERRFVHTGFHRILCVAHCDADAGQL